MKATSLQQLCTCAAMTSCAVQCNYSMLILCGAVDIQAKFACIMLANEAYPVCHTASIPVVRDVVAVQHTL